MKKYFNQISLVCILFFGVGTEKSLGQYVSNSSKPLHLGIGYDMEHIIGSDNSGVYVIKMKNLSGRPTEYIEKYAFPDYTLVWSHELDYDLAAALKNGKHMYDRCLFIKGQIVVIAATYNRNRERIQIGSQVIHADGKAEEAKVISEVEYPKYVDYDVFAHGYLSPDSTYLAVSHTFTPKTAALRKKRQDALMIVINLKELKEAYSVKLMTEYSGNPVITYGYEVDNKANLIYSMDVITDLKLMLGEKALCFLKKGTTVPAVKKIEMMKDYEYSPAASILNSDGTYMVAGFFANEQSGKGLKVGIYYYLYNSDKNEFTFSGKSFLTKEVISKLYLANGIMVAGHAYALKCLESKRIVKMKNDFYFVGANAGDTFVDMDLIVTKITSDGKMEWMRTLPNRDGMSDLILYTNDVDKLLFMYGANNGNFKHQTVDHYTTLEGHPKEFGYLIPVAITLTSAGVVSGDYVKADEAITTSRSSIRLSPSKILIAPMCGKEHRFMEVDYK